MKTLAERLVADVRGWPHLRERPEDYGAVGWTLGRGTIGHVHMGSRVVDVLFTRAIRDQLLRENLAEQHRYQPNSGWVTWRLKLSDDLRSLVQQATPSPDDSRRAMRGIHSSSA